MKQVKLIKYVKIDISQFKEKILTKILSVVAKDLQKEFPEYNHRKRIILKESKMLDVEWEMYNTKKYRLSKFKYKFPGHNNYIIRLISDKFETTSIQYFITFIKVSGIETREGLHSVYVNMILNGTAYYNSWFNQVECFSEDKTSKTAKLFKYRITYTIRNKKIYIKKEYDRQFIKKRI